MKAAAAIPVFGLALILSACATTGGEPLRLATPEDPLAMSIPDYKREQAMLVNNLAQGNPRELDEQEWDRLGRIQNNILELLGDADEIEEIDLETRYTIFQLRQQMVAMVIAGTAMEMVCVRQQLTGTRLGQRRRCMTRAEWEQSHYYAEYVEEFVRGLNNPLISEGPVGRDPSLGPG
jgi:hypothetical protein